MKENWIPDQARKDERKGVWWDFIRAALILLMLLAFYGLVGIIEGPI